jgi:Zn-dependent peptidase ImmA (M78 family)/transcriptional regulator with XRE-family HTH domain
MTSGDRRAERLRLARSAGASVISPFDPARLIQARHLAGLSRVAVAETVGVPGATLGQWESGATAPRPDQVDELAGALEVPVTFFAAGRPHARLDAAAAHFRSLRATSTAERNKAAAFAEQVWELTCALEHRVQLPPVDLPGFAAGELARDRLPADPAAAARELRRHWDLEVGPIPHLVRTMENRGLIVTLTSFAGSATARVDAFSTALLPRPVVVLTPDRANDVYRHRFTAAHELGHLLLHDNTAPADPEQEREADVFAAELLTPRDQISTCLPTRLDLTALRTVGARWGVSVDSLIYRCRDLGIVSEAAYRRSYQRLRHLRATGLFPTEPVDGYPGEMPCLLGRAFGLAEANGLSLRELAAELAWPLPRLRLLLGIEDIRPELRLV